MASPRDIRRRIKSVTGTVQITRAMEMVAASKMRRAQQASLISRPFGHLLYRIQRQATTHARDFTHPLLESREVRTRGVLLVGTDKGLCGALNGNLFRLAGAFDPETTVFMAVGRQAAQFIARTGRHLVAEFTISDSPRFAEARAIAAAARDLFVKGEVDQVQVVATRFINTLSQEPIVLEFLPVGEIKALKLPGMDSEGEVGAGGPREFLFEPNAEAVLTYLLGHYLNIYIFRVMLEHAASEQSARMVAMKNATDSATRLIGDLTLSYNHLRQGNITTELLDIAGGQLGDG
jgi:F-type H+-transporting ATPase subunit gamma